MLRLLSGFLCVELDNELQCVSYSVHLASRTHGLFYHGAHLAGILSKTFA